MRMKHILLVDDDEAVLISLSSYLEARGYHVTTAPNGSNALQQLAESSVDLVITDLVMGGLDGIALLGAIRAQHCQCGVFILTGEGNMERAIEALRLGAEDFLIKPCAMDELTLRMERFFEKQDAIRKLKIYEDILPICMYCKKIRDDTGTAPGAGKWLDMSEYLCRKSGARLSHGCCPECFEKIQKEWSCFEK